MLIAGKVKWFDPVKGFGEITARITGRQVSVFFSLKAGCHFVAGENSPIWAREARNRELSVIGRLPSEQGDDVLFEWGENHKGPFANIWGFADEYRAIEKNIAQRIQAAKRPYWENALYLAGS